jgi:hypothetical protein
MRMHSLMPLTLYVPGNRVQSPTQLWGIGSVPYLALEMIMPGKTISWLGNCLGYKIQKS